VIRKITGKEQRSNSAEVNRDKIFITFRCFGVIGQLRANTPTVAKAEKKAQKKPSYGKLSLF
jgi:hypothetical protein